MTQVPKTLQLLLYRPQKIVRRNYSLDSLLKRVDTSRAVHAFVTRYRHDNPLSLLYECVGYHCPNNRLVHSYRRAALAAVVYEQAVAITDNHLRYLSWGSAGLLSDAIILANILHRRPYSTVTFHGIDAVYAQEQSPHPLCHVSYLLNRMRQEQIAQVFSYYFPRSIIRWHWYTSTQKYLDTTSSIPHIIVAADIPDDLYALHVTRISYTHIRAHLASSGTLSINL